MNECPICHKGTKNLHKHVVVKHWHYDKEDGMYWCWCCYIRGFGVYKGDAITQRFIDKIDVQMNHLHAAAHHFESCGGILDHFRESFFGVEV
jgi:hypothetical protein